VAWTVALLACCSEAAAQDWPQWRGAGRDARVTDFAPPAAWPETLTAGWKVSVGDGVATPALVGGKLYVFARQDGQEILRCLDAETGKELWKDGYEVAGADGPARSYAGPRSSPTVAQGKVLTLGVRGHVSCLDAASGKLLWRKTDLDAWPRFYTSSSPIVVGELCIVQLGSESEGAVVAYDLASGERRWTWSEEGTAYASPVLLDIDGATQVVVETSKSVVGLTAASGELVWQTPFVVRGRGYNAATPIVAGGRLILTGSGRGTRLAALEKQGERYVVTETWSNEEQSVQYNTPVVVDGLLYGLSDANELFCVDLADGKTCWKVPIAKAQGDGEEDAGGRGGRRGGGGRGGYGSVVAAGGVLFALSPSGELVVFGPGKAEYQELARYAVADGGTYAYPIIAGKRIYVKDRDSVAVWMLGE
jgi:outer membrane protein assembly factor BamB